MVKCSFRQLVMESLQMRIVATNSGSTGDALRRSLERELLSPAFNDSLTILKLLTDRKGFLHDKLNPAHQDYNHSPVKTRTKKKGPNASEISRNIFLAWQWMTMLEI